MQFLVKHFEKLILSVVLVGLVVACVLMMQNIQKEKRSLDDKVGKATTTQGKSLEPRPFDRYANALTMATNPPAIQLTAPHMVFNPVLWKRKADGTLIANKDGTSVGVGALEVKAVKPLKFMIEFNRLRESGDRTSYEFNVVQEDQVDSRGRSLKPRRRFVTQGDKLDKFMLDETNEVDLILTDVVGPVASPEKFVFTYDGTTEQITVTPTEPFSEVRDHTADLYSKALDKNFPDLREGSRISVEGEDYLVHSISDKQVILSAVRNQKRTTIPYNPESAGAP